MFITARGREEDVLYGYSLGCDDYVVKPFSLAEFYAKTQALLKRAKGMVAGPWLSCGEIAINPSRYLVSVEGH
jgi:DNA-binding response OmpR family regulator